MRLSSPAGRGRVAGRVAGRELCRRESAAFPSTFCAVAASYSATPPSCSPAAATQKSAPLLTARLRTRACLDGLPARHATRGGGGGAGCPAAHSTPLSSPSSSLHTHRMAAAPPAASRQPPHCTRASERHAPHATRRRHTLK